MERETESGSEREKKQQQEEEAVGDYASPNHGMGWDGMGCTVRTYFYNTPRQLTDRSPVLPRSKHTQDFHFLFLRLGTQNDIPIMADHQPPKDEGGWFGLYSGD